MCVFTYPLYGKGPDVQAAVVLTGISAGWEALPDDSRPPHPLAPLVAAWLLDSSPTVQLETRRDSAVLPVVHLSHVVNASEAALMTLHGLSGGRAADSGQLPLWSVPDGGPMVPLLETLDAAEGLPIMAQGRGAPLLSRLVVYMGLAVNVEDRKLDAVRFSVTVRTLQNMLWPNGWQKGRDWPRLRNALLKARDVAFRDSHNGYWFPLQLQRLPDEGNGGPALDDLVVMIMSLPPGAHDGPPVQLPYLYKAGVKSGPRWRAYIAARSVLWTPGKTRIPVRYGAAWAKDANKYPVLTRSDRRRLIFGPHDTSNRTAKAIDSPWDGLPGVVIDKDAQHPTTLEAGWRILPAERFGPDSGLTT